MSLFEMSFVILCACLSVTVGLMYVARARKAPHEATADDGQGLHFLFRGPDLEHASPGGGKP